MAPEYLEWDRADSLARFVLPHPTGRRGLSGLQRAPTRRSGTPSAPLLQSGETAWKAQICLLIEKDPNEKMNISEDILNAVIPPVWASEIRTSKECDPGKDRTETRRSTEHGLLRERQSEFNTPILHVKKPHSSEYRLDAAFCIPVDEQSQTIFAFEWENATPGRKTQLCCTVLPQGFENGPTSFGKVRAKELELWQNDHDAVTLLQYVDDLLIGSDS
ncbi:hypothetical protein QYF61_025695 [Mycteria americana]|uniref:ribonuclease H n=1 Tax=Mycteria americana TaxID=33587 RepID=A0AAN7RII2_MYCAM|nr:hypothetical protein QYF61_025695 [Mycteria americana]